MPFAFRLRPRYLLSVSVSRSLTLTLTLSLSRSLTLTPAQLSPQVLGRYVNGLLAKCYLAWQSLARGEAGRREELTRSALSLLSGKHELLLLSRFVAWRDHVLGLRDSRYELLRRALLRMRNRQLHACWNVWLEMHAEFQGVRKAARAWVMAAASRAWRTWAVQAADARRLRDLAQRMLARWRGGVLTKVFVAWADATGTARAQREEAGLRALSYAAPGRSSRHAERRHAERRAARRAERRHAERLHAERRAARRAARRPCAGT